MYPFILGLHIGLKLFAKKLFTNKRFEDFHGIGREQDRGGRGHVNAHSRFLSVDELSVVDG